jgi:hypothetical protein
MEKPKCLCGAIKGSRHVVSCPEKLKSDRRKKAEKRLGKRLWV